MNQKELNYIEDAYNHEKSILCVLESRKDKLNDDHHISLYENMIEKHEKILKKLEKLLEANV